MASAAALTTQGARPYAAIPEPSPDLQALAACCEALKIDMETLLGLRGDGTFAAVLGSDVTSGGTVDLTGLMTHAKVMSRISLGF